MIMSAKICMIHQSNVAGTPPNKQDKTRCRMKYVKVKSKNFLDFSTITTKPIALCSKIVLKNKEKSFFRSNQITAINRNNNNNREKKTKVRIRDDKDEGEGRPSKKRRKERPYPVKADKSITKQSAHPSLLHI